MATKVEVPTRKNARSEVLDGHREKSPSGNGTGPETGILGTGHTTRLIDGPSDLTMTYDGAERLTQVKSIASGSST